MPSVYDYKLPPPRAVSPLIRTARWTLLVLGIGYGALRLRYLRGREVAIKAKNDSIIEKKVKEYRENFALQSEKSMIDLAKEAGITPKKN